MSWGYNAIVAPNDRVMELGGADCTNNNYGSQSALGARSFHPGGVNAGMADGSVRFVSETVDLLAWRAAASMAGGESLQLD